VVRGTEQWAVVRAGIPLALPTLLVPANAAPHKTGLVESAVFGVGVSVRAMRSRRERSANVLGMGDSLQVGRVATRSVAAEVVDLEPLRDRTDRQLESEPVCGVSATVIVGPTISFVVSAQPNPTRVVGSPVDASPELLPGGALRLVPPA